MSARKIDFRHVADMSVARLARELLEVNVGTGYFITNFPR